MKNELNEIEAIELFKKQACAWAQTYKNFCILDNNHIENAFGLQEIEFAIAVGSNSECLGNGENDFDKLKQFVDQYSGSTPLFGYLSYDLKNQLDKLSSQNPDSIEFASLYFFAPEHIILIDTHQQFMVLSEQAERIMQEIKATPIPPIMAEPITIKAKVSKEEYIQKVNQIKEHIIAGDVYELNYCVEFYAEQSTIDPLSTYYTLKELSPTPFACLLKHQDKYLISASPERFMKKSFNKLYSQPIKGTIRRASKDEEDEVLKSKLLGSEKEKAENLMIVDLVRNDLSKSCEVGTVEVEELYGIYSFKQVHQMISTVSGTIIDGLHPVDALSNAFPMGSMTGAPKLMAMKLIEQFEQTKRGLYSGAVGYFAPNEDFDFNVVIRSIQYNQSKKYVNFEVGSAITFDSVAEEEYEECLLKASAMLKALGAKLD
ncbi:MAG: anthranilate synthase component I family protein [Bacteroidia bacterium]|nr:anthranilate synthase component I family protein [Bacteroidia bacterium]